MNLVISLEELIMILCCLCKIKKEQAICLKLLF